MKKINNWVLRNLFWGAIFLVGVLLAVNIVLYVSTQHGITVNVPDMSGMSLSDAEQTAQKAHLKVQVIDSVFVNRMRKGVVYLQSPAPDAVVKRGRMIDLTINAMQERQVKMPNLVGITTLRQARTNLKAAGLELGRLVYVEDMATNVVLGQKYNGQDVVEGMLVPVGSKVDLVLGRNSSDARAYVPRVIGDNVKVATENVKLHSLNVGKLKYDNTIRGYSDSLNAFVYKQSPVASESAVKMGSEVTLYLTLDQGKLPSE